MQIARPSDGFRVTYAPFAKATVDNHASHDPLFARHWGMIVERLKMTGHRDEETTPIKGDRTHRVFVANGDAVSGLPTIATTYRVLGDQLTFLKVMVVEQ